ncbi:hypothetical protein FACS1894110_10050 [Spirochaetia bacterium]|nr:hypothetical protein FACS1894110_10050 [Spirochaetia bacterium]
MGTSYKPKVIPFCRQPYCEEINDDTGISVVCGRQYECKKYQTMFLRLFYEVGMQPPEPLRVSIEESEESING